MISQLTIKKITETRRRESNLYSSLKLFPFGYYVDIEEIFMFLATVIAHRVWYTGISTALMYYDPFLNCRLSHMLPVRVHSTNKDNLMSIVRDK
jgi:hypothetical protein